MRRVTVSRMRGQLAQNAAPPHNGYMAERTGWTRGQQLVALRPCLPFGRLHGRNPEIVALAGRIGRTAGALAMKACNFARLDLAALGRRPLGVPVRFAPDPAAVRFHREHVFTG